MPSSFNLNTLSIIASTCISYNSGYVMAKRQPRCPSIGFTSFKSTMRLSNVSFEIFNCFATFAISSSECGKNSCNGGSSKRTIVGCSPDNLKISLKSST